MHLCQVRVWRIATESLRLYRRAFGILARLSVLLVATSSVTNLLDKKSLLQLILKFVIGYAVYGWFWLAMLSVSDAARQGRAKTFAEALRSPYGKFWHFVGNTIAVFGLGVCGVVSLQLLSPLLGIAFLRGTENPARDYRIMMWMSRAATLASACLVVWLLARVGLYGVAITAEAPRAKWYWPIQQSWQMMKGHVWRGLGAWVVPFAGSLIGGVVTAMFYENLRTKQVTHWELYWLGALLVALAWPLFVTTGVVLYRTVQSEGHR